jgi:hypothetical protein
MDCYFCGWIEEISGHGLRKNDDLCEIDVNDMIVKICNIAS